MIGLQFESRLAALVRMVWATVSSMDGVNAELRPLLRMSHPAQRADLNTLPVGALAFASWLLLFGVLPIDRHFLRLERVFRGEGFDERSETWTQRERIHQRRGLDVAGGCVVHDQLEFTPRIGWMRPLLRLMVGAVFTHRHRRLRTRFGALGA